MPDGSITNEWGFILKKVRILITLLTFWETSKYSHFYHMKIEVSNSNIHLKGYK